MVLSYYVIHELKDEIERIIIIIIISGLDGINNQKSDMGIIVKRVASIIRAPIKVSYL